MAKPLALAMATSVAAPSLAAPPPPPPTVSELVITAAKTVSELLVTGAIRCLKPEDRAGASRPKVVSAFPARGAEVRPGLLVVRVTFDQPIACAGRFDADPPLTDPCPGHPREMLLSYDRRTVRTLCMVEPGAQYGFSLGQDPNAETFLALAGGLPAQPAKLAFTTSAGPAITNVCEALAQDPETAAELARRGKTCSAPG